MNIHDLREAQARFELRIPSLEKEFAEFHALRKKFVAFYTPAQIQKMTIDEYALGNDLPKKGYNFCYTLERKLDGLGRILGARADKFGVYYGKIKSDQTYKYRFTSKFGKTYQEAFKNIKTAILELISFGAKSDIESIIKNPISPMFKGKILSTYFPDKYLNIFSDDHIEYFLVQLNLDTEKLIWENSVIKRNALVNLKKTDKVMKNWSLDLFMIFLYSEYPGWADKKITSPNHTLSDYRNPVFPAIVYPEFIDLSIASAPPTLLSKPTGNSKKKTDYEKEARVLKKLGDRGEKIVLDLEREILRKKGRKDLAAKVKQADYDYEGFDIVSFEFDGTPKYIEVKATRSKVNQANFFLTSNELAKAKEISNYFLYMVFDILSEKPKIWPIKNPFNPENKNVVKHQ
jgi:hypothetical protein